MSVGIEISHLEGVNTIIIKGKDRAFITTKDSVIFDKDMFTQVVIAMILKGMIDYKILEGVLEDIHTNRR